MTLVIGPVSALNAPFAPVVAALSKSVQVEISPSATDVTLHQPHTTVSGALPVVETLLADFPRLAVMKRLAEPKNLMQVCQELDSELRLISFLGDAVEPGLNDVMVWSSLRGTFPRA